MEIDERELIVAANRYVEGGRKPEDLVRLAENIAKAKSEEELRELLRLAGCIQPAK